MTDFSKMSEEEQFEWVAGVIETEGLGYAVTGYMSADSLPPAVPEDIYRAWNEAAAALNAIERFFEPYMP